MFILDEKYAVPQDAMDRAISGFMRGIFVKEPGVDLRRERIMRAAFYECYARLCLSSAYPQGIPSELQNEELTVELIERAVDGIYSFRKELEARKSWLALECRWMLEGFLRLPISVHLESWNWKKIDPPAEPTANPFHDRNLQETQKRIEELIRSHGKVDLVSIRPRLRHKRMWQ